MSTSRTDRRPESCALPSVEPSGAERFLIATACQAPSVRNTQPWNWQIRGEGVELRADRSRQLLVTDPSGRNLAISCGAALHHLQVAAPACGFEADVDLLPDPDQPDLLARVRLTAAIVPDDAAEQLAVISARCTDRRRFTAWPIPDDRLHHLVDSAFQPDVEALPVVEVGARLRTEMQINRAAELVRRIPGTAGESASGVEPPTSLESTDGLILISTPHDDELSWVRAGVMLSSLWLRATATGLSVVPLSQVIDVDETRGALRGDLLGGRSEPQLLLRIGWQEIGRATLPRTARRPLDEVLTS
jgi:hypothetical protein